jgi:hypothetical protein
LVRVISSPSSAQPFQKAWANRSGELCSDLGLAEAAGSTSADGQQYLPKSVTILCRALALLTLRGNAFTFGSRASTPHRRGSV